MSVASVRPPSIQEQRFPRSFCSVLKLVASESFKYDRLLACEALNVLLALACQTCMVP
jgi:hypothetical protein